MVVFEGFLWVCWVFCFFLPLLNVCKIGVFVVVLLFLWGVYVFCGGLCWNMVKGRGLGV